MAGCGRGGRGAGAGGGTGGYSAAMSAPLYTCITCRVGFRTAELQRNHYKSDWHRYNLKRKVGGAHRPAAALA